MSCECSRLARSPSHPQAADATPCRHRESARPMLMGGEWRGRGCMRRRRSDSRGLRASTSYRSSLRRQSPDATGPDDGYVDRVAGMVGMDVRTNRVTGGDDYQWWAEVAECD